MGRTKKPSSKRNGKRSRRSSKREGLAAAVRRGLQSLYPLRHIWIVVAVFGAVWGVRRLEAVVLLRPEFRVAADVYLPDVPDYLEESIKAVIAPAAGGAWTDPQLCRRIGHVLEESAWVRQVNEVRRYADGSVVVSCDYRDSAALVQSGNEHYLIAGDGVRLPGVYSYHLSLIVIQGVKDPPPMEGETWPGGDVKAALGIISSLRPEPFFDQITGVLVGNFDGRRDRRQPHIMLAVAPSGSLIVWGSAPGLEIEENSMGRKIQILERNFLTTGHIDAGYDCIDISAYSDRFTTCETAEMG